jgi:anti-anti-sigma regulatory factor
LTYRIHRSVTPDTVVFALSGEVDLDHATRLQEFLTNEATGRVTFDLGDVTLVDRASVRFLAGAEAAGIRLVNCPDYIRSWIAAERDWQQEDLDEPAKQEGDHDP